jgi:hypothetical protein
LPKKEVFAPISALFYFRFINRLDPLVGSRREKSRRKGDLPLPRLKHLPALELARIWRELARTARIGAVHKVGIGVTLVTFDDRAKGVRAVSEWSDF